MKIGRRKKRSVAFIVIIVVIVLAIIAGIFGYVLERRVRSSPEYLAQKVAYLFRHGDDYAFVYVDSTKNVVKILNLENKKYLYDPKTKELLNGENLENDFVFFRKVFDVDANYSFYINLDGGNILKFSRVVLGTNAETLKDLLKALRMRKRNFFDFLKVDAMANELRFFSNLTGPAILKIFDSLGSYMVSEMREIDTLTKNPVEIIIGREKEKIIKRLYLKEEAIIKVKEFLGTVRSE